MVLMYQGFRRDWCAVLLSSSLAVREIAKWYLRAHTNLDKHCVGTGSAALILTKSGRARLRSLLPFFFLDVERCGRVPFSSHG